MLERIDEFIERAYKTACEHGFHDEKTSFCHQMMLVVGEVGECVEADRKGKDGGLTSFKKEMDFCSSVGMGFDFNGRFEMQIKDTMEDEMADICIRLFDMCGCFGIKPYVPPFEDWAGMQVEWDKLFCGMTLTEQAYHLVQLLGMYDEGDDGAKIEGLFGSILGFIHHWAVFLGVDLATHIDLKMKYNEGRAYKHGKKY